MNKKDYQKPAMRVVLLQQQAHLLAGSNELNATRGDGYGEAIEEEWN